MFELGSKVRVTLKRVQGGVVMWSNGQKTGILVGSVEAVYANELLESIGATTTNRRKQRNRRRVNSELSFPAVFVDASYHQERQPNACIAAVIVESKTRISSRHLRHLQTQGVNLAEIEAMLFGSKLRPSESWPIYSDSLCAVKNACDHHKIPNVIWIPRHQNHMADRVTRNGWDGIHYESR